MSAAIRAADLPAPILPCPCGNPVASLARNVSNNGVDWRCPACWRQLSLWIPRARLTACGIDPKKLPPWRRDAEDRPELLPAPDGVLWLKRETEHSLACGTGQGELSL